MPWMEVSIMDERLRFVARRLEGGAMTDLCAEFWGEEDRQTIRGIVCLTNAQDRAQDLRALQGSRGGGSGGSSARSGAGGEPACPAHRADDRGAEARPDFQMAPHWGARKLRELLARRMGDTGPVPARSTIHAVLDRHGLVEHAIRRPRATGTALSDGATPNDLWCVDLKGEFQIGDHRYC